MRWLVAIVPVIAGCGAAVPEAPRIAPGDLAPHVRFLSHDLLEGRGVGGRGEALTVEYLATHLELAGAEPAGDNGTYYQAVPLVEVETQASSSVRLAGRVLEPLTDYVGNNERQTGREAFDADVVFVGHGIAAPEFAWDDFKGVDVRGKLLVLFTNEPPSEDEALFEGEALTYYGRWTFKFEEAARRGAAGALIVHTDETAGYPWSVVRNSWSGPQPYAEALPGEPSPDISPRGVDMRHDFVISCFVSKQLQACRKHTSCPHSVPRSNFPSTPAARSAPASTAGACRTMAEPCCWQPPTVPCG